MVWRRSSRRRERLRAAFVAPELAERAEAAGTVGAGRNAVTTAPGISVAPAPRATPFLFGAAERDGPGRSSAAAPDPPPEEQAL